MSNIYITTPIYYVNARPHIGHAYTSVVCDFYARFCRLSGFDVKFVSGTDEHGKKVEQSAVKAGKTPQEFTDNISSLFRDLLKTLNASNDDFIRTTQERHRKTVQHFWNVLSTNGFIYLGEYKGWYDVRNEAYFAENELIDGKSPLGGDVTFMSEPCYFFKLSAFESQLLEFYEQHPDFIFPKQRKNEVISFIKQGLSDLAISRATFSWGVPVPNDPKHVVYVWLDALTNYLTMLGYPENADLSHDAFWKNSVHFVGKEIVRFHAIYWPAFLMAAGINPPKQIVSHGWWLSEGEKMSKSLGNVQDPVKYCKLFGSDALRYFLLRELPFGADGNFSLEGFANRYNSVLANSFGNLCNRILMFAQKYCSNSLHRPSQLSEDDRIFRQKITELLIEAKNLVPEYAFHKYLEKIEEALYAANQYFDAQRPWTMKENNQNRMEAILFNALEAVFEISKFLMPVIPTAITKLRTFLGFPEQTDFADVFPAELHITAADALFPRIDKETLKECDVYAKD